MRVLKILPLLLMLLIFPARSYADMPDITAGETYFDVFKGYYVLKDNVHVTINNHGHHAIITANEAKVNVLTQKCWANGKVKLTHDNETFSCDNAYLQWKTKTAEVVGNVNFNSKKNFSVTSETAIFNWENKIVDFYGNVKVTASTNINTDNKIYSHLRYNVLENKILQLEEIAYTPIIQIPNPDSE